jgi:hypothetical protein
MSTLFAWIESTALANAIAASLALTASLSAMHLLGFTLVLGSALVGNLRRLGALLPQCSLVDVVRPANRAIVVGLAISVSSGALLFAARASDVSANGTFRLKMLLLLGAAACHFATGPGGRVGAVVSLAAWLALAVTACAFILLE